MKDENKSKEQVFDELVKLRQQVADLEKSAVERKRTETLLQSQKNKFEGIIASLADGLDIITRDYRINYQNKLLKDRFGDLTGELCYEGYMARKTPCESCPMTKAIETGITQSSVMTGADGRSYQVTATPFQDIDGETKVIEIVQDITERKRAEEALRESERFLESVFEGIQDGISILDTELNIVRVNRWVEKMYADQMPLVGKKCYEAYHRRDSVCPWCPSVKTIEKGKPHSEFVQYVSEGEPAGWIDLSAFPLTDADGRVVAVIEHVRDITEIKRAEEALRESEGKLNAMLDSIGDHMSMMDEDLNILWANKTAKKIFGNDIIGKKCYEAYHRRKEPCEPYPCLTLKAFEDGKIHEHDTQVIDKDGRTIYFRCTANVALRDKNGEPTGVIEISRDMTESKRAERALRESEEKYRMLISNLPSIVFKGYADWSIEFIDEKIEFLTGYSVDEFSSQRIKWSDLMLEEDIASARGAFIQALKGDRSYVREYRIRTRTGEVLWLQERSQIICGENDQIAYVSGVFFDITDKKRLERQLLQAQKMEAVGTLAGGVAHDFNNLLQAVRGYAELLLLDKNENAAGYWELQEICRAARRGGELTQQLLTFSRKVETKRQPLDLNHEVRVVRRLLERTISKMIEIELYLSDNLKVVSADPTQTEQVIMNLAVNAKDAMPEGGRLIIKTENVVLDEAYCKIHQGTKPGDYVLLSISDTGGGIDRQALKHIYEPFYTTKGLAEGTGLGLAMVYGIVKNHDGYINCCTEPGEGTTFEIYFPVIEHQRASVEKEGTEASLTRGTETILLVDDEEFVRDLGTQILTRFGYTVVTSADGESALEIFLQKKGQIDLVILDVLMPGMGGRQCMQELLRIDPQARVLIATGYSPDSSTKKALEAGASGYISKPFDLRQILREVRKALDRD
jgi:PAS domain S-box-containing protein